MSDELVDALAARLWQVTLYPRGGELRFEGTSSATREYWRAVATETVRQMRWARGFDARQPMVAGLLPCICGVQHIAGHPIFSTPGHALLGPGDPFPPLTLAPDEFQ